MPYLSSLSWQGTYLRVTDFGKDFWLMGMDVCECLGFKNHHSALARLPEDERRMFSGHVDRMGRNKNVVVVNEAGIYRLILTSRCEGAQAFQHWLFHDLLPTLRKKGEYRLSAQCPQVLPLDNDLVDVKELFPLVIQQQLPFPDFERVPA